MVNRSVRTARILVGLSAILLAVASVVALTSALRQFKGTLICPPDIACFDSRSLGIGLAASGLVVALILGLTALLLGRGRLVLVFAAAIQLPFVAGLLFGATQVAQGQVGDLPTAAAIALCLFPTAAFVCLVLAMRHRPD